ncbi:MAG: HIRAN domain-containing protein [Acidobacteria bacterium]|nr:HIRAN domain-containing protein [Acidobacteriota bacterium]
MNRRDFLKSVGFAAVIIPAYDSSISVLNKPLLLEFPIAGYQYYKGTEYETFLKEDEKIILLREPENPYDEKAVAVYFKHIKLGYIPRIDNKVIANLLDRGINILGMISKFIKDNPTWDRVWVNLFLE